jgi:FMN hydrolase / 5-amino-6-(5-phospho-D-ribitylamino)uracil phosphatase
MSPARWIVLDVGETLIDETRFWAAWADELGISRLTFMAGLGAVIARGGEYRGVFDLFGITGWQKLAGAVEARHGGFTAADLYPDAAPALDALQVAGYRVAITANQPAIRDPQLRSLGIDPDVMAMSEAMGVSKPDPAFFTRTLELLGDPPPRRVAYVGDRIDNDMLPAIHAGLRPVWLRRGPWGRIQALPSDVAGVLVVGTLAELVDRVGEVWADADERPGLPSETAVPAEDGSPGDRARSAGGVRPASR